MIYTSAASFKLFFLAESGGIDSSGRGGGHMEFVVEAESFGTPGERDSHLHFRVRLGGGLYRFDKFTQENRTGHQYVDIYYAEGFAMLHHGG